MTKEVKEVEEKEQNDEELENKEEPEVKDELLQLKKDFAKEYFTKLQKDQGFSLSGLLLSETGVIEDYLTAENPLDMVKDNVVKEFVLKNVLTEDILSQLETIKTDINNISTTNKEEVEKIIEELRIKYKIKESNLPLSSSSEKSDIPVTTIIAPVVPIPAAESIESEVVSGYGSPFPNKKNGKKNKLIISSFFGKRTHPIRGEEHMHTGIDISEEEGTPIKSMCDGIVTKNRRTDLGGREIFIKDVTGKEFCYLHLVEKSPLSKGSIVKIGQEIGKVGSTGSSTGPHLHLTVKERNRNVDPIKEFPDIFQKNVA